MDPVPAMVCADKAQSPDFWSLSQLCFLSGLFLPMKATAMTSVWLAQGVSMNPDRLSEPKQYQSEVHNGEKCDQPWATVGDI